MVKKVLSMILALVLVCSITVTAFAGESAHDVESLVYCTDEQTVESYREGFAHLPVEEAKADIMNAFNAIPRLGAFRALIKGISDLFSALVKIPSRRAAFSASDLRYNTETKSPVYREAAASDGTMAKTIPVIIASGKPVAKDADAGTLLDMYNNALKKTNDNGGLKGIYASSLIDGSFKSENDVTAELVNTLLSGGLFNFVGEESQIPGDGAIEIEDIRDIYAASVDGKTIIRISLNDQTSDGYGTSDNYSVKHGVGDLGNFIKLLTDNGIEIAGGEGSIEIKYTGAYITCIIDDATGKITGGTWQKTVSFNIEDVEFKIRSISLNMNYSFALDEDIVF